MEDKFNQELLGKIKEQKIKPKWHFLLKDYMVWSFGFLSLVVGSLSFSIVIYLLRYNDWGVYDQIDESFLEFVLLTMPYFWIVFLVFFGFLVYYNIKHTKKGYRFSFRLVMGLNVLLSMVFGILFYGIGVGKALDEVLGEKVPLYSKVFNRQVDFWSQPERGRLTGLVVLINDEENFTILDLNQNEWWVVSKAKFDSKIEIGRPVRMLGKKIEDKKFEAKMILKTPPPGAGLFKRHKKHFFPSEDERIRMHDRMMQNPLFREKASKMRESIKEYPEAEKIFDEMIPKEHEIGMTESCEQDVVCELPFDFAIRSNCPYEAKCIEAKCSVVCPVPFGSLEEEQIGHQCDRHEDCECGKHLPGAEGECACLDGGCALIVE